MAPRKSVCEKYEQGESPFGNSLDAGGYWTATRVTKLPAEVHEDDRRIRHGWAVGFGQWFFFEDLEPAIAFGRAARMSLDCAGYGVYRAAHEIQFCERHNLDEVALLVNIKAGSLDRRDGEGALLARFVQGVQPGRSYWQEPDGRRSRPA